MLSPFLSLSFSQVYAAIIGSDAECRSRPVSVCTTQHNTTQQHNHTQFAACDKRAYRVRSGSRLRRGWEEEAQGGKKVDDRSRH